MPKKNILFIRGIEDNSKIFIKKINTSGQMDISLLGNIDLFSLLESEHFTKTKITLDTSLDQKINIDKHIDVIFNQITEADSQRIVLSKLGQIYNTYKDKIPFFNSSEDIQKTYRDTSYRLLNNIEGLDYPKTVKLAPRSASDIYNIIEKEKFDFPVIIRPAGIHGGYSTQLIENDQELFYAIPLDGRPYYLTQYIDYAKNSLYTKYRFIVIDGEVYLRHVIISDRWNIQGEEGRIFMRENSKLQDNAIEIIKSFDTEIKPHIQHTIKQIHEKLGLDYFGIDCSLDDNFSMLIFEINASMYLANPERDEESFYQPIIEKIQKALVEMINK